MMPNKDHLKRRVWLYVMDKSWNRVDARTELMDSQMPNGVGDLAERAVLISDMSGEVGDLVTIRVFERVNERVQRSISFGSLYKRPWRQR